MSTNSFTYNGLDTRVGMTDSSGSKSFKHNGIYVTDPVLSDGTANFTPSGEVRGGVKTTYHSGMKNDDIQTSASQAIGAAKVFDAFGNELSSSGAWGSQFGYAGQFGYQGDGDSGLKLLGHRYYDSSTGRFLTRDPVKDGRNWYSYCENNPISQADATGLYIISGEMLGERARQWSEEKSGAYDDLFDNPGWSKKGNQNTDCGFFVLWIIRMYYDSECTAISGCGNLVEYLEGSGWWYEVDFDENYVPEPGDVLVQYDGTDDKAMPVHTGMISHYDKHGNPMVSQRSLGTSGA